MPDPYTALAVFGSQVIGGAMQADAATEAAGIQAGAAEAGVEEQRRQFNRIQEILAPYIQEGQSAITGFQPFRQAGAAAFEQQAALLGFAPQQRQIESKIKIGGVSVPVSLTATDYVGGEAGRAAQEAAIRQIESSPFLQSQIEQGERALLQRASATGGLRGGNLQAALAQFRPLMLQQAIEQQYARLGGFAGTGLGVEEQLYRGGQASAAGQALQAGTMGSNVANLLAQQGAAQAGGALGQARGFGQALSAIPQGLGAYYGATGRSPFGGMQAAFSQTPMGSSGFGTGMAYGNQDIGLFL